MNNTTSFYRHYLHLNGRSKINQNFAFNGPIKIDQKNRPTQKAVKEMCRQHLNTRP